MYEIAIIGMGNIGFRHLEGLLKTQKEVTIHLFDVSEEALMKAKSNLIHIDYRNNVKSIEFHQKLSSMPDSLDLAIIATPADFRLKAIQNLIANSKVKSFILEKFIFNAFEDYNSFESLIDISKVWINCTRREWDVYQKLRDTMSNTDQTIMKVYSTGAWLGSNAIHFLDLLFYLSRKTEYELVTIDGEINPVSSKRDGYIEFEGVIHFTTSFGKLSLFSIKEKSNQIVTIQNGNDTMVIDETFGNIYKLLYDCHQNDFETYSVKDTYQSSITFRSVTSIIDQTRINLTPYLLSSELHKAILEFFKNNLEMDGKSIKKVPIT